jgi:hypothetical protein
MGTLSHFAHTRREGGTVHWSIEAVKQGFIYIEACIMNPFVDI